MMAFRYTLQSMLRLRQSIEHQEEQRLYATAAAVAQLRAKLEQLERERVRVHRETLQERDEDTFGATFQFIAACEAAASQSIAKLQMALAGAERLRIRQLEVYKDARGKREIFEALRDQQKASYDLERAHRDQEQVDEAFLMRRKLAPSD